MLFSGTGMCCGHGLAVPKGVASLIFHQGSMAVGGGGCYIISICGLSCKHVMLFHLIHTKMSWNHF